MVIARSRARATPSGLPGRRGVRWWRLLGTLVGLLSAAIAVLGLVAHYRTPGRGWVLGVSAFSPYLMLAGPFAVLVFAVARRRLGVLLAVLLTGGLVYTQGPLYVSANAPAHAVPLVVMTSNLRLGLGDPDAVVAAVRRHHVQVLMLEELTAPEQQRLVTAGLDTLLPHHVSVPQGAASGTGLWTADPIVQTRRRTDFTFEFVTARLRMPGVPVDPMLAALHMAGPYPDSTVWQRDIAHLAPVLAGFPLGVPTVVGGDFNSTPDVAQFRAVLAGGYADAAEQAGAGTTRTYPSNRSFPPLIAIDHVLTRGGAVATGAGTVEIAGSDHRALLSTIAIPTGT